MLRRTAGLSPTAVAWLREVIGGPLQSDPDRLATLLRAVPMSIGALMPIDRAISSAGGVALEAVDQHFMLRRLPGGRADRRARPSSRVAGTNGIKRSEAQRSDLSAGSPGTFVVGEMLDWEAPTGGYLLQATFSTAVVAARAALARLAPGVA